MTLREAEASGYKITLSGGGPNRIRARIQLYDEVRTVMDFLRLQRDLGDATDEDTETFVARAGRSCLQWVSSDREVRKACGQFNGQTRSPER